jgi:hypothetical protein
MGHIRVGLSCIFDESLEMANGEKLEHHICEEQEEGEDVYRVYTMLIWIQGF